MSCALCTAEYYLLSVFDFHSVHFSETKDFCEMFKIMKFCAIVYWYLDLLYLYLYFMFWYWYLYLHLLYLYLMT